MTITFINDKNGEKHTFNNFHKLEKFTGYVIVTTTNPKNKHIRISTNDFTKIQLDKW